MYGLMVDFEHTRPTTVSGGRNKGMNFRNVAVEPGTGGDGDHSSGGDIARKIECWRCGGDHMKKDCPKRVEEKENKKKDGEEADNKRAEVTGGSYTQCSRHWGTNR